MGAAKLDQAAVQHPAAPYAERRACPAVREQTRTAGGRPHAPAY
jgi:hypothetical protein